MERSKDSKPVTGPPLQAAAPGAAKETPGIGAVEVAAYLRKHPNFLAEHPELIASLTPPEMKRGNGVVDMQHFMLLRLQGELTTLRNQQRALLATSRSNLASQNRVHAAVVAIIGAKSFEQLIQTVTTDLAMLLDVDVVTIGIESTGSPQPRLPLHGIQLLRAGAVDSILGEERDALMNSDVVGDQMLFGSAAGLVRSEALLRIEVSDETPVGMLCIGTRRPERFHPGQGTELLSFLARTLEMTIAAWLNIAT